ncbi:hypothetical protein BMS3Bbin12_00644 [bacterium BMS3Bbin12]|nr:hypothetical protein BMS3Abin12_00353 [bacterium BMS3Abin12]GBE47482.1 hypothetical protein BMS3Bbin12_00644 [bacterium BMS3Bbin12]GBE51145.1 hypothetical protein BMS3Bbin13_02100 [bacterium BMS3Bbin13]
MAEPSGILDTLGGARYLGRKRGPVDLRELVRAGLPYQAAEFLLLESLGLALDEAARLLAVSRRTLTRKRQNPKERLGPAESDRLYRLARTLTLASEVLGDDAAAREWLKTPNRALGGDRPLDLLDTEPGVRAVEDVLDRAAWGDVG